MAKRNQFYRSHFDVTKSMVKDRERIKQSTLPDGFSFVVIDDELHIKQYSTSGRSRVASLNGVLKWTDLDGEEVHEQLP